MNEGNTRKLSRSGIRYIVGANLIFILKALIFFCSAGHVNISRAWMFFGVDFLFLEAQMILWAKYNPELLNQRGERKKDTKSWDKIIAPAIIVIGVFGQFLIIGLDVGRYHWSTLGIYFLIVGLLLYVVSKLTANWAMIVNPYFETTARIQLDRRHRVITTGPYSIVRHPSYSAGVLYFIGVPLFIGSVIGLIPGVIAIFLVVLRTMLEDNMLKKELEGYIEYAQRVKYRLFPYIW